MEDKTDTQDTTQETFRRALSLLCPDEDGKVHKDLLKQYFQKTLGTLFEEDMTSAVLDHMKPDENGMISVEGFMEAFSTQYWSTENLAVMHDVLKNAPHVVKTMVDWKNVLANMGVELSDDEVSQLLARARTYAADLLSAQIQKNSNENQVEAGERTNQIYQAVQDQLHLLDIGTNEKKCTPQNQPEGQ